MLHSSWRLNTDVAERHEEELVCKFQVINSFDPTVKNHVQKNIKKQSSRLGIKLQLIALK